MKEGIETVDLSVVVAAQDGGGSLQKCLSALTAQLDPPSSEIIVVEGSESNAHRRLGKAFPSVRFIRQPEKSTVPELWSSGIALARGRIIALTIEHCLPAHNWGRETLRAHAAPWPAIGGAVEMAAGLGLVDSAVYFCRYSRYMLPFSSEFLDDLPGDNCSYKRAALEPLRDVMAEGFWETFIHLSMRRKGEQLLSDPSIIVFYAGSFSWLEFLIRRFAQGSHFARRRSRELLRLQRLLRAAVFPVIPLLMLKRIAARVCSKMRYRGRFLACLPLLFSFLVAWSMGEGLGYLLGPSVARRGAKARAEEVLGEIR